VLGASGPIQVVDGDTVIGAVGRDEILTLIAERDAA
jgi:hypothetical protein